MKKLIYVVLALAATVVCLEGANRVTKNVTPNWTTDYQGALQESKATGKPIFLFFTGSDWCIWCKRLESEVLNTPEFVKATRNDYIFVMVDLPMEFDLSPSLEEQNDALKAQYGVKSFPTVLMVDGNEKVLLTTGYRSGGGKRYANYLRKQIDDSVALR